MSTSGNALLASPIENANGRFYQIVGTPYCQDLATLSEGAESAIHLVWMEIAGLGGVERVAIETVLQDFPALGGPTPTIASIEVHFSGVSTEVLDMMVQAALSRYADMELVIVPLSQSIVRHRKRITLM
jgi:hypothetical protein